MICCLSSVIIREMYKMWLAAVPIFQGTNPKDRRRSLPRSGSRYGEPWRPHTSWMAPRLCRILHRPRKDFRQTEQLSWPRSQRFELLSRYTKFYACDSLLTNGFLHHLTEGKLLHSDWLMKREKTIEIERLLACCACEPSDRQTFALNIIHKRLHTFSGDSSPFLHVVYK